MQINEDVDKSIDFSQIILRLTLNDASTLDLNNRKSFVQRLSNWYFVD